MSVQVGPEYATVISQSLQNKIIFPILRIGDFLKVSDM
jgi:hypothetical protein